MNNACVFAMRWRIDSLDLTEIILEVEDEFDLIVEDEESIHTLNDLISRVDALTA